MEGKADLLSLFLESPDVFTDDDIIDELLDFLLAGTQTTSYATLTLLAHLAKSEESTSMIRKEFNSASSMSNTESQEGPKTVDNKFAHLMSQATLERV